MRDKKTRSHLAAWQAFVTGSHTSCPICRRRRDHRPRGSVTRPARSVKSARRCTAGVRRSIRSLAATGHTVPPLPRSVKSPVASPARAHTKTRRGAGTGGAGVTRRHEDTKTRKARGRGQRSHTKTRRHEGRGDEGSDLTRRHEGRGDEGSDLTRRHEGRGSSPRARCGAMTHACWPCLGQIVRQRAAHATARR